MSLCLGWGHASEKRPQAVLTGRVQRLLSREHAVSHHSPPACLRHAPRWVDKEQCPSSRSSGPPVESQCGSRAVVGAKWGSALLGWLRTGRPWRWGWNNKPSPRSRTRKDIPGREPAFALRQAWTQWGGSWVGACLGWGGMTQSWRRRPSFELTRAWRPG